jgi:hypothetical protein
MKPFIVEIYEGSLRDTVVVTFPRTREEICNPLLHQIFTVDPEDPHEELPMCSLLLEMTRRQWRLLRQRLGARRGRRLVLEIREENAPAEPGWIDPRFAVGRKGEQ